MPKKKTPPTLGQQIRTCRQAAGMLQVELGAALTEEGVSQAFIVRLETDRARPNVHHLIAICQATDANFSIDGDGHVRLWRE